ncbi:MAG: polyprenyl synthetase family protein [Vicinamibacteria bacterium]
MSPDAFARWLDERRRLVETALEQHLTAPPACPAVVLDAMRYSLLGGGKRLRPLLVLASAEAVASLSGRSPDEARALALPAACAVEMIHTYSLIHDDLPAMDDDTLRRGRPTLHVAYGEGMAILAGDGLHAEAFLVLARAPDSDDPAVAARKLRVIRLVGEAAGPAGMVGGQALDLQAVADGATPLDATRLEDMHARKTGALIRASAEAGAVMAGADDETTRAVTRYATAIGLAFQIVDDILDVEGSAEELGKSAGKDAASGKLTRSRELAAECADRARAALDAVGLHGHLPAIVEWTLTRQR